MFIPETTAPVRLQAEYQTPWAIKKGQQAFLQVRALVAGIPDPLDMRVEYQCGLFATDDVSALASYAAIATFPPARFVPAVSGSDTARVTFTAKTTTGIPAGRWTGDALLTVDEEARPAFQITNTGNGEVRVMGAPMAAPVNFTAGLAPVWKALALTPDASYQRRLAGLRKPTAITPHIGPLAPPGQAHVVVEDRTTGTRTAVAVMRGLLATLGRGGKPDTSWWVQGEPLNRSAHLNISGLHTALNIREGYAWVTDFSRFGTRLNGAPLTPKEATTLADGDDLDLADGFRVRVGLAADADGVGAVWLSRTDAHAGRLTYALVARSLPTPAFSPGVSVPVGWLAWTAGQNGTAVLQYRPAAAGTWTAVPPDQSTTVGPLFRVGWRPVAAPRNQELDLNPNPPILS